MADSRAQVATDDVLDRLASAARELEQAEAAVDVEGESSLRQLADAYESFLAFIDENDGRATGSGREAFQAYVRFQDELVNRLDRLPEDLLARDAFERVGELLDKRRLTPEDMQRARDTLEPAAEKVRLLEERREARQRYRRARSAVEGRLRTVETAIDDRERLLDFADADLDADLSPLRTPVESYNEAVQTAFREFKRTASARDLLALLDVAADYPLVDLDPAPEPLADYLRSSPVGEESTSRLLELADYTPSKLAHYVDDPDRFRATVGANRSYLDRLDATPLAVDWPPPPANELWFRARELVSMVDRFAPDAVVARLHELRGLTRTDDYETLRWAAIAQSRLDADERERLQSGAIENELERLREERASIRTALDDYPDR